MKIAEICAEGFGNFKADGRRALEIYEEIIRHGKYWAKVNHDFWIESHRLQNYKEALRKTARIYFEGKAGIIQDRHKADEYLTMLSYYKL